MVKGRSARRRNKISIAKDNLGQNPPESKFSSICQIVFHDNPPEKSLFPPLRLPKVFNLGVDVVFLHQSRFFPSSPFPCPHVFVWERTFPSLPRR
jgi:hypothetical protein